MGKHISVWLIEPLTNLHVGNESTVNFSIIDKAIQRDALTNLPCINSGSLKGAIKEYINDKWKGEKKELEAKQKKEMIRIFGSDKEDKGSETNRGSVVFFDANILALPVPEASDKLFKMYSNEKVLGDFNKKIRLLGADKDVDSKSRGWTMTEKFKTYCDDDSLPIIARNCLDNGESKNLWYEQVLPPKTVLGTIIQTANADDLKDLDGAIVQIGANATIGYGYCKFIKL